MRISIAVLALFLCLAIASVVRADNTVYRLKTRVRLTDGITGATNVDAPKGSEYTTGTMTDSTGKSVPALFFKTPGKVTQADATPTINTSDWYEGAVDKDASEVVYGPAYGPLAVPFKLSLGKGSALQAGGTLGGYYGGHTTLWGNDVILYVGGGLGVDQSSSVSGTSPSAGVSGAFGVMVSPGGVALAIGYDHGTSGPLNNKWWISLAFGGDSSK